MDAFISRKRRKISQEDKTGSSRHDLTQEQSTDEKLAILASVFEDASQEQLLDALLCNDGSVELALDMLLASTCTTSPMKKASLGTGIQSSLTFLRPELDLWEPGEHNGTFRGNNTAFVNGTAALRAYWADPTFQNYMGGTIAHLQRRLDRKSVVQGKSADLGGRRFLNI